MKQLILFTFFCISLFSFAGKPYNVDIKIYDLHTLEGIEGLSVRITDNKNNLLFSGLSDKEGMIHFMNCKLKYFTIETSDKDDVYSSGYHYLMKDREEGEILMLGLRNLKNERLLIQEKTAQTPIDSAEIVSADNCVSNYIEPGFQGGPEALTQFIIRNFRYPEGALDAGIDGRTLLAFYINPEGIVSHVKIVEGIDECTECDDEAIRMIAYFPKWNPATCNGKAVGTIYNFPFKIKAG